MGEKFMLLNSSFDNMWKVALVAGLCLTLAGLASSRQVCYYDSMAETREGPENFTVSDIDLCKCTHLIYAFADINEQYELVSNSADDIPSYMVFNRLKTRSPQLKTLLAVGGPNFDTHKFSKVVESDQNRAMFIQSTIRLLRSFDFDGLDLNWWYPGGAGGQPEDEQRFTALCEELKQAFEDEGVANNDSLILTATISAEKATIDTCYDMKQIATTLDFINMLMFDLHDGGVGITRPNSPLNQGPQDIGDDTYQNIVNYIQRNEFGGAFVWSLDKDDFSGQFCEQGSYPFINHLHTLLLLNVSDLGMQNTTRCLGDPSFCNEMDDGDYANSMSPNCFYSCVSNITYIRRCPANLIFVEDLIRCERRNESMTTTPSMTTASSTSTSSSMASTIETKITTHPTTTTTVTPTTPTTTTTHQAPCQSDPSFCNEMDDGHYANSMSPNCFYSCVGNITYIQRCPANLIFREESTTCERRNESMTTTPSMTKASSTSTSLSMASTIETKITTHPTTITTAIPTTPTTTTTYQAPCHSDPSFCNERDDGHYANSMSPNCFYSCVGNITHIRRCPANLIFVEDLIRCERRNESMTTTPSMTTASSTSTSSSMASTIETKITTHPTTTTTVTPTTPTTTTTHQAPCQSDPSFCNEMDDGHYANSMSPNCFYSCVGNITYIQRCPANLIFVEESTTCERRNESLTTTPSMTTASSTSTSSSMASTIETKITTHPTTTTTATQTTPTTTTTYQAPCHSDPFFCNEMDDGDYANSMSPNCFYSCVGNITYIQRCPANLIFVEESTTCERRNESLTTTPSMTTASSTSTSSSMASTIETKITTHPTTTTTATQTTPTTTTTYQAPCHSDPFFCNEMDDGDYANSMSPSCYYSCVSYYTYIRRCPANLIFVEDLIRCGRRKESMTTTHQVNSSKPCGGKSRFYPDPNNTRYFFLCENGKAHHLACAPGTVFDETCHCCNFP